MEVFRLKMNDYDELISLMDSAFTRKYGSPQSFEQDLPKMCVRDDEHMSRHLGIRENGRLIAALGIYPLPLTIAGEKLLFSTVGNVTTHWEHEGRGCMNLLLNAAMDELARIGADASRLGGQRQRYNRYGYEPCGTLYRFVLSGHNVLRCFPEFQSDIHFEPIRKSDDDTIRYTYSLYKKGIVAVDRGTNDDIYASLTAWQCRPYVAIRPDGTRVGYICAAKDGSIAEFGADSPVEMLCVWQRYIGTPVTFTLPPYEIDLVRTFSRICDSFSVASPSHFKIIHWDKVVSAFLKVKATYAALPDEAFRIHIRDYGTIRLLGSDCTRTDDAPDITLNSLDAARYIFGPLPTECTSDIPCPYLPLPLSWNSQDRV